MKTALITISLLILSSFQLSAQYKDIEYISLAKDKIRINDRKFYISDVIDDRSNKSNIGFVKKGLGNKLSPAQFEKGLVTSIKEYLDGSLEKEGDQFPVLLKINRLEISEEAKYTTELAHAELSVSFFYQGIEVHRNSQRVTQKDTDVTYLHERNIREALALALLSLQEIDLENPKQIQLEDNPTTNKSASHYSQQSTVSETKPSRPESKNRNIMAVGYQIGGFTLIGIDYEIRVADYFGIHFGGGLAGATAGIKIHTNPDKNSAFFNLNYKDGGFGGIGTAGVEYGGRWVFNEQKSELGLHYQIGLGKYLYMAEQIEETLFKGNAPPVGLTLGLGLSW